MTSAQGNVAVFLGVKCWSVAQLALSNAVEIGLINVASGYIREIKGTGYTLNPELIDLMKEWRRACGLPEVDTARKASGEREKAREARIQEEMEALSDGHWHEGLMRLTCLFATCEEFIARLETHPEFRKKADRYRLAISLRESHDAKNERNGFVWNGKPNHIEEAINIEALMKYTQTVSFIQEANKA